MKPIRLISLSAIFVLFTSFAGSTEISSGSCLDLKQSKSFHFEGTLTYQVFPGPPNFEDVRKGDKPEPTYILQLKKPICVSGDEFIDPEKQIDRIQIFPDYADKDDRALWNELRRLVGKFVAVDGSEPFGAHTGHHHAPFLLPIKEIALASHPASK
jgi:hypothetical protein